MRHEIVYHIDEANLISFVNSEWFVFAKNSGAADLAPDNVVGHPFLNFICDRVTRHLFTLILDRIRQTQKSMKLPFRCDSATLRRFMKVTISPIDELTLEFRCQTLKEEPRDWTPFFQNQGPTSGELLTMCSWAKK